MTHAANRADHKKEVISLEVSEPERIVFQHLDPPSDFSLAIACAEEDGRGRE